MSIRGLEIAVFCLFCASISNAHAEPCKNPIPLEISGKTTAAKLNFVDGTPGTVVLKKVTMYMIDLGDGSSALTETLLNGPSSEQVTNKVLCEEVPQKLIKKMYVGLGFDNDRQSGESQWDANVVFLINDIGGDHSWVNFTKASPGSDLVNEKAPANVTEIKTDQGAKFSQRVYEISKNEIELRMKYYKGGYSFYTAPFMRRGMLHRFPLSIVLAT